MILAFRLWASYMLKEEDCSRVYALGRTTVNVLASH